MTSTTFWRFLLEKTLSSAAFAICWQSAHSTSDHEYSTYDVVGTPALVVVVQWKQLLSRPLAARIDFSVAGATPEYGVSLDLHRW